MDHFFDFQTARDAAQRLDDWLVDYVLTPAPLQQILIVLALVVLSFMVARRLAPLINHGAARWGTKNTAFVASRIHLTTQEVLVLIFAPFLLWIATAVATAQQAPNAILNVAASLVGAWSIIRLGSGIIKSRGLSKALALFMCLLAGLNILGWLRPVMDALDKATLTSGTNPISLLVIIKAILLVILLLWVSRVVAEGFERAMWRSKTITPSQKVLFSKLARITLILLAILIGLNASGIDLTALAVFSGALGIGVGFGLQKVFSNLISGFILLMDKSIKPGDVIAVADTYGWVNHIGARHVSILTRDGKEHLIPNETLITQPVENWSYSNQNIRIHIPITVSYNEDRRLVKKLLLDVTHANARILKDPAPTCLIEKFGERGVEFEIRAWIEDPVNGIGNVRSSIYEAVWDMFKEHGIAFPAPQRDVRIMREE